MKIQILEKSSGKIKTMDKRYAEILVRLKLASFVENSESQKTVSAPLTEPPHPPENPQEEEVIIDPAATDIPEGEKEMTVAEDNPVVTEEELGHTDPAESEQKDMRAGKGKRGKRSNKYETKVMTAKE